MSLIHVALQEGFQNDTVIAQLDGTEVYRRAGLNTRMQIGLADSFDLKAPSGRAELRVDVVTRKAHVTVPVEVPPGEERYVGISIAPDGKIVQRISEDPFHYA